MWLFTRTGFISVTEDPREPHRFLIRARRRADLERLAAEAGIPLGTGVGNLNIYETPKRDYRWRMSMHRADFVKVIVDQLMEVDYSNVKDAIDLDEPERHSAMLRVWSAMLTLQDGPVDWAATYRGSLWDDHSDFADEMLEVEADLIEAVNLLRSMPDDDTPAQEGEDWRTVRRMFLERMDEAEVGT
jgi:hypothetical protein